MTRAFVVCLGLAATLLASCTPPPPTARIVVFTASDERIPRNTEVTLVWQAADAGVQNGFASCVLTRRFGDETTETPVQATCAGSVTEVPPAPLAATTVEYRFKVLKQPFDPADPYRTQARSVTLDAALYAVRAGGTESDVALGVSTLEDGGAIVAGSFAGTATFGTTTLTSVGGREVFVARIRPDGTWAWATRAGGTGNDTALSVSTRADGSSIVAGSFSGTAFFGGTPLISQGANDAFVARIDPDGTWAWATRAGGTESDPARSVSALEDGGAIVAGSFAGTATFGATNLTSAGANDAFVARIGPDGAWVWANRAGGAGNELARGVSTLADGSAIVAGSFAGTSTFGTTTLVSAGINDAFVARIGPDGAWVWANRAGGAGNELAHGVSTLADGSALIVGQFTGSATFGTATIVSAGNDDVFVARTNADGTWAWAARAGGTSFAEAQGVSALADGGAIVTGHFTGTTTFGATTLANTGSGNAFVARIDPDGTWAWANRAGGTGNDVALSASVSTLSDGGAVVAGSYLGTTTFGATTLPGAGDFDAFVARISADGAW